MQTQNAKRAQVVLAALFALLCVGLMIVTYRSFGGSTPLQPQGYRFSLTVDDAGNLVSGSDVQQAGVKIGKVKSVQRVGSKATVTVEMLPRYSPVKRSAKAMVRTKSLLGEAYVELRPGTSTAPLPDGGILPATNVLPDVSLNEFLDGFGPRTRYDARRMFAGMARAFRGRGKDLNGAIGTAAPATANLQTLLTTLSEQTADLQGLIGDSSTVLGALGRRQGALQGAIKASDDVFGALADRDRALAATIRELPPFLGQLERTSRSITSNSGPLERASRTLLAVSPKLPPALDAVKANAPQFTSLFRALPATVSAGQRGLPAATQIANAIPPSFDELYPALRQLIPIVQLLADYAEPAVVGPFSNAGSIFAGTTVGPNGKISNRVNGALYLSNETVVGYKKRLSTNRANPYPKPDGFTKLGQQGFLNSYDCRNANKPPAVLPTGSGVPPCVEQGPWTYRGKHAYYPRLSPASP